VKPLRYQELARMAVGRMNGLSEDPVAAVCWAIEKAIDEHLSSVDLPTLPTHCRGMRRVALWLAHHGRGTPSAISLALGTTPRVVSRTLRRMRDKGITRSDKGRWSLVRSPLAVSA
jgi:DNA-binding transcriptional ArsR family regulator